MTNTRQQADTGTKMIHLGKNTRSTIVSKGISAGFGQNSYRESGCRFDSLLCLARGGLRIGVVFCAAV